MRPRILPDTVYMVNDDLELSHLSLPIIIITYHYHYYHYLSHSATAVNSNHLVDKKYLFSVIQIMHTILYSYRNTTCLYLHMVTGSKQHLEVLEVNEGCLRVPYGYH